MIVWLLRTLGRSCTCMTRHSLSNCSCRVLHNPYHTMYRCFISYADARHLPFWWTVALYHIRRLFSLSSDRETNLATEGDCSFMLPSLCVANTWKKSSTMFTRRAPKGQ